MRGALAAALALGLAAGCVAPRRLSPSLVGALQAAPRGFLSGTVVDLGAPTVLEDRDFGYAVAFSPDSRQVAFAHLGSRDFLLSVWTLEPALRIATVAVNASAFDVEDLAFSPDGSAVAVVSRDGTLRVYSSAALEPLAAHPAGQPLVSVAFAHGAPRLLVGTATGRVQVLEWPSLRLLAEHGAPAGPASVATGADGAVFVAVRGGARALHRYVLEDAALREREGAVALEARVNDLTASASGERLGVALSWAPPVRTPELHERERRGQPLEDSAEDKAALVERGDEPGQVLSFKAHVGIVSTAAISPDGRALASGGWDRQLVLHREGAAAPVARRTFAWILRKVRFSPDGRWLAAAAWTPQSALGGGRGAPSVVVYEVLYGEDARVVERR